MSEAEWSSNVGNCINSDFAPHPRVISSLSATHTYVAVVVRLLSEKKVKGIAARSCHTLFGTTYSHTVQGIPSFVQASIVLSAINGITTSWVSYYSSPLYRCQPLFCLR